jgi:hypothetical protein
LYLFYVAQKSQITLIIGHHRWLYISPAEITEITEIFGPSQMAIYKPHFKPKGNGGKFNG